MSEAERLVIEHNDKLDNQINDLQIEVSKLKNELPHSCDNDEAEGVLFEIQCVKDRIKILESEKVLTYNPDGTNL